MEDDQIKGLQAVIRAAEGDLDDFVGHAYLGDEDRLLDPFCEEAGISRPLTSGDRKLILRDYRRAYLQHARAALAHNATLSQFDLEDAAPVSATPKAELGFVTDRISEVSARHLDEGQRSNLWMAKTLAEKREALHLLVELVKDRPMGDVTKADARAVKAALQKLPKNRNKSPATKRLTLEEMLAKVGLPIALIRTLNAYVSHFQTFYKWAVEHGFADNNIFAGMRFRMPKRDKALQRDAFTTVQLGVMFKHLTENANGIVPKDEHKWVTLIAMFTGARLNEVAQLGVSDLMLQEGVWCFFFTTDGDDGKHLKTEASKRLVPVHDR